MLNKYPYTLSKIEEIIDNSISDDQDSLFVCDFALAHYIYDYLANDYGLTPDAVELSSETQEYYMSLSFYKDGDITFICESARGIGNTYKYNESDEIDYYIFTDMSFGEAREFLDGKGDMQFCELVDDEIEEFDDDIDDDVVIQCDCDDCVEMREMELIEQDELEDECQCDECRSQRHDDVINKSVGKAFDKIVESEGCPNCIIDALMQLTLEMKRLGWSDHREYIRECNG